MKITHRIPWGIPYGYTEIEYDDTFDVENNQPDWDALVMEARNMESAYLGLSKLPKPPEYPDDPGPAEPPVPTTPRAGANGPTGGTPAASSNPQTRQDAEGFMEVIPGEKVMGEHFACPDCGAEVKPSIDRYQEWEVGDDGRQYAQKFFCPNNACGTKSLWRSKLRPLANAGSRR